MVSIRIDYWPGDDEFDLPFADVSDIDDGEIDNKINELKSVQLKKIHDYMAGKVEDFVDPFTDEVNTTALAEQTAIELGHPEWLEDEQHVVWDLAVDVGQARAKD